MLKIKDENNEEEQYEMYRTLLKENAEEKEGEKEVKCPIDMEIHDEVGKLRSDKSSREDAIETKLLKYAQ